MSMSMYNTRGWYLCVCVGGEEGGEEGGEGGRGGGHDALFVFIRLVASNTTIGEGERKGEGREEGRRERGREEGERKGGGKGGRDRASLTSATPGWQSQCHSRSRTQMPGYRR